MELNFIKNEAISSWECEFEAKDFFALHIEGVNVGNIQLYQRTTSYGKFAFVENGTPSPSDSKVYDYDSIGWVFPKFIKVVCRTEPTYAEVVSNGEITELKYQEKSVEVTANGNTEVIPDAGFMGLTKVNVSVNVPQSGGGGGSASSVEYLDVSNISTYDLDVLVGAILECKGVSDTLSVVSPAATVVPLAQIMGITITQAKVDFNTPIILNQGGAIVKQTALESLLSKGFTQDYLAAIPRITEEEFYNLNA